MSFTHSITQWRAVAEQLRATIFGRAPGQDIVAYVNEQNEIEQQHCARIYTGADSAT
jgi:hypothetical protein